MNFGGLDPANSTYESSHVVFLPIPFEATTTYRAGTREGPGAILRASRAMELYDEELDVEPYLLGLHTMEEVELSRLSFETAHRQVEELVRELLAAGKFPVLLGGEHSLSLGAVRACKAAYPDLSVVQLDAHADLRDTYEDTRYSHACIARRIVEICPLVQVGIRSMSREEADFLAGGDPWKGESSVRAGTRRDNVVFAKEIVAGGAGTLPRKTRNARKHFSKDIIADAAPLALPLSRLSHNVYVTIDLDVFDPSEMPAVGTPEPGGLSWFEVLCILRQVASNANVVGFDVVELCPLAGNIAPDFLAAKLIYKMLAYRFADTLRGARR